MNQTFVIMVGMAAMMLVTFIFTASGQVFTPRLCQVWR